MTPTPEQLWMFGIPEAILVDYFVNVDMFEYCLLLCLRYYYLCNIFLIKEIDNACVCAILFVDAVLLFKLLCF